MMTFYAIICSRFPDELQSWPLEHGLLKVCQGLILTDGSPSHPEGTLRVLFIRRGKYIAQSMRDQGIPLTIQNLINEFIAYRQEILSDILHHERKYYKF